MPSRPLDVAQHEAAHVVVGTALGLRLRRASAAAQGDYAGYCWFYRSADRYAHALACAAGLAYERAISRDNAWLSIPGLLEETPDETQCRAWLPVNGERAFRTCVRAADAMLRGLGPQHARVTRLLLERDLWPRDMAALTRGQRVR